jgi:hypothetical protein
MIDNFGIIFLVLLYFNLKICVANNRTSRDVRLSQTVQVLYLHSSSLPVLSLIVLGFLIMKWYMFLPILFVIIFDPLTILFGINHAKSTMTFVFKNYVICIIFNLITSFGLWFYYLSEIKNVF